MCDGLARSPPISVVSRLSCQKKAAGNSMVSLDAGQHVTVAPEAMLWLRSMCMICVPQFGQCVSLIAFLAVLLVWTALYTVPVLDGLLLTSTGVVL